jgi:hypothetical protein
MQDVRGGSTACSGACVGHDKGRVGLYQDNSVKCYHPSMSRGSGRIERRIGELFAGSKDRAVSIGDLAAHAFELKDGAVPDRKQRLSAIRAAHRLLRRAAAAKAAVDAR